MMIALLLAAAEELGVRLRIVGNKLARAAVVNLVTQSQIELRADKSYRSELAAWAHPIHSASHDGLPESGHGFVELDEHGERASGLVLHRGDFGPRVVARDQALLQMAPVLALLETDEDTSAAWLMADQALENVLLCACAQGLAASIISEPMELPGVRSELRDVADCEGIPQLLLHIGFHRKTIRMPRRTVSEVLMNG